MFYSSPKESRIKEHNTQEITLDSDDSIFDFDFSSNPREGKSLILPLGQDGTEKNKTSTDDEDLNKNLQRTS